MTDRSQRLEQAKKMLKNYQKKKDDYNQEYSPDSASFIIKDFIHEQDSSQSQTIEILISEKNALKEKLANMEQMIQQFNTKDVANQTRILALQEQVSQGSFLEIARLKKEAENWKSHADESLKQANDLIRREKESNEKINRMQTTIDALQKRPSIKPERNEQLEALKRQLELSQEQNEQFQAKIEQINQQLIKEKSQKTLEQERNHSLTSEFEQLNTSLKNQVTQNEELKVENAFKNQQLQESINAQSRETQKFQQENAKLESLKADLTLKIEKLEKTINLLGRDNENLIKDLKELRVRHLELNEAKLVLVDQLHDLQKSKVDQSVDFKKLQDLVTQKDAIIDELSTKDQLSQKLIAATQKPQKPEFEKRRKSSFTVDQAVETSRVQADAIQKLTNDLNASKAVIQSMNERIEQLATENSALKDRLKNEERLNELLCAEVQVVPEFIAKFHQSKKNMEIQMQETIAQAKKDAEAQVLRRLSLVQPVEEPLPESLTEIGICHKCSDRVIDL